MLYLLYPQLRKLSGAERLILRLAAHAAAQGAALTLVTHYMDPACRPALDPQVRLIETGWRANLFHNHYLDATLEYLASVRLLARIGDDAQAITFFGPPSLPALYWSRHSRRRGLPHLYFCYEPPRVIYDDTREIVARMGLAGTLARPFLHLYKGVDRRMAREADVLMGNSRFGAERLWAAYEREAVVITHGVDLFPPSPAQVNALATRYDLVGRPVVLTVNFLHPRKRIDLFLRAFARIHAEAPTAVALVVGAGPEAARLDALAHELGIQDAVRLTGFVPDEELPAYYALATLYLHTCKRESFGLSVLEASAAGVPVVAVDEGGPREIIVNGESGLLVDSNPAALAAGAVLLLENEERRRSMGEVARRRVAEYYTWDKGAQTFLDIVRRVSGE
ncbi:MAG: glycosyltransferase [Anaerolineae bacterium]